MHPTRRRAFAVLLGLGIPPSAGAGEHIGAAEVRAMVAAAPAGGVDLSGKDLSGDDLTGLDLSGARLIGTDLSGANLHGVKLVGADLTGANLSRADLTFAWFIRAKFDHANLSGATLQTVVTSTGMENTPEQAASFVGANLSDAKITVHFSFDDMRGANFSHADMTVVMANQSMGLLRTEFVAANLDGAKFFRCGAGSRHLPLRQAARCRFPGRRPQRRRLHRRLSRQRRFHRRENVARELRERDRERREGARSDPLAGRCARCTSSHFVSGEGARRERFGPSFHASTTTEVSRCLDGSWRA